MSVGIAKWFGTCPMCHGFYGPVNVGPDHFAVCNRHQVRWYLGEDLFSGWIFEGPEDWAINRATLARYTPVIPYRGKDASIPVVG